MKKMLDELKAGAPLVCMRLTEVDRPFLDSNVGECTLCGEQIVYRRHNEVAINKICFQCQPLLEKARQA